MTKILVVDDEPRIRSLLRRYLVGEGFKVSEAADGAEMREAFEREANRVWESGRRHYSARTIGEYLRHESALRQEEPDEDFKLNNNIFPSLARIYMAMHPERFGFFERRPGGSAVRAL